MRVTDFGVYIVIYNLVIGVLLMVASEKLGVYAGNLAGSNREKLTRYTRVSVFTFGSSVAALSAVIYIAFHILRIGID